MHREARRGVHYQVTDGACGVPAGALAVAFNVTLVAAHPIEPAAGLVGVRLNLASVVPTGNFYTLTPCRVLDTRLTGVVSGGAVNLTFASSGSARAPTGQVAWPRGTSSSCQFAEAAGHDGAGGALVVGGERGGVQAHGDAVAGSPPGRWRSGRRRSRSPS